MLVSQVYFQAERHAFHLFLRVEKSGHNILMSTIPICLLWKYFPSAMHSLKHAFLADEFDANDKMEILSKIILNRPELHNFFYQDWILENNRIPFEDAEQITKYQEMLPLLPGYHFSTKTEKLKFFVLNQIFLRKQRHILRTAKLIPECYFKKEYIFNAEIEKEYLEFKKDELIYLELAEAHDVDYVLILDKDKNLKLFLSV